MKILTCFLLTTLMLTSCSAEHNRSVLAAQTESPHHASHSTAPAAVHGMVLFGENELFASHIPMFMVPHDWQALFKITLSHPTVDALALYKKARKEAASSAQSQTLFTLRPQAFILPPLLEGKQQSFVASLYQGNFEDGGKELLQGITVKVDKVLTVDNLNPANKALSFLSYTLLKDGTSSYLVHKITAPDNFDQILEVKWLNKDAELTVQSLQVLTIKVADTLAGSLNQGQTWTLTPDGTLTENQDSAKADLSIVSSFYCTVGPDFFQSCP